MKLTKSALRGVLEFVLYLSVFGATTVFIVGKDPSAMGVMSIGFFVLLLLMIATQLLKRHKDTQTGVPDEDERSTLIKYKAGYYSFFASGYVWIFIGLFGGRFSDVSVVVASGIMVSLVLSIGVKSYITAHYHEDQD